MVFCVESGAKGAEEHGIVLMAAPLRLYWSTPATMILEILPSPLRGRWRPQGDG